MLFGDAFQALLKLAQVALAALLLVGVPLADAATCAGEELLTHTYAAGDEAATSAASSDAADHEGMPSGDGEHCIHGHCHHSIPFRTSDASQTTPDETRISSSWVNAPPMRDQAVAGLERPPKV